MSNSQTPELGTERTLRSSVRNPRRRQRQSDGDSLKTAPRRKRSKLSEDQFAPARESVETGDAVDNNSNTAVAMNGHLGRESAAIRRKESTPALSVDMELPVRGSRKAGTIKRAMKGDGATVLTANKFYNVKLLPSTPKELRRPGLAFRGTLLPDQHLALAVTREKAYIWDYTSHAPATGARVFDVPFAVRANETLPFGALVPSGAGSNDVGLVLVAACGGKVVFYESIERAASLGLFHERRTGVEGNLAGIYTGEAVTEVASAEHAGFVITLSSGRITQMTLRDAQGKPRISSQFLQSVDPASKGLFGTIKRFAGLVSKSVTAVRTRSLGMRGQMQAIALTDSGAIEMWDLDWSGRSEPRGTVDFRDAMIHELRSSTPPELQGRVDRMACLDLAIRDKPAAARGDELATLGTEQPVELWLLLSMGNVDTKQFYIGEITLAGAKVEITRLMQLRTYYGQGRKEETTSLPRLLVPKPGHTAFVVFEDAVILAATVDPTVSSPDPNAQLHEASYIDPEIFEDAVFMRSDGGATVMGACQEPSRAGQASSLAFIKGAGLVRFSAIDPAGDVERSRIPAKSKIEQAVFYGQAMQPDNILDLNRKGQAVLPLDEVEEATLAISEEVVRSATSFITRNPTNVAAHLDYKTRALAALVAHVSQTYPPLSRTAMWQLLGDAEKIAAAQGLWQALEEDKSTPSKGTKIARVLDDLCSRAATQYSWDSTAGEDAVQSFLVNHLAKLGWLLGHTRSLIREIRETPPETQRILSSVEGADEIWLRVVETAFAFRAEHGASYGIPAEHITEGILTSSAEYVDLPEPWLSTEEMLKAIVKICTWSRELAKQYFEQEETVPEVEEHCRNIVSRNPRLVQLCCLIHQERIYWLASRPSEKAQQLAAKLETNYTNERHDQFRALADVAQAEAGMKLAEKYRDMGTLTEMVVAESQFALETCATTQDEDERLGCEAVIADIISRIGKYFERFGDDWADAFFDEAFSSSRAGTMLSESQHYWGEALTRWLRADPSRAKLCWINDVTARKDYSHASAALTEVAVDRETMLWAKKVELSMSKLALLAAAEETPSSEDKTSRDALFIRDDNHLRIVKTQEKLYRHFLPVIMGGIDREAELEMAMVKFAKQLPEQTALRQLLEAGVERVLQHHALPVEELVDVLTLMDTVTYEKEPMPSGNLQGSEFYQALVALDAASETMPQAHFEMLLQLMWKRCYIADDWVKINNAQTGGKGVSQEELWSDIRQTAVWRTMYHLYDQQLLLNGKDQSGAGIRVLAPSECLGAACRAEDLAWRFGGNRDLLDPILNDNRLQDEQLQSFVADRRLDEWVEAVEKDARTFVEAEVEDMADARERDRQVAEEMKGSSNGEKVNGFTNGVKREEELDEDGDVGME